MSYKRHSAPLMNADERRAYARGYQVASHRWPDHKPPTPPDPVIAELVEAMRAMRDTCDCFRATLCEGDEFGRELELVIDRADAALTSVTRWLRT